jgi:hypothetical protein
MITFRARCTTCKKTFEPTAEQQREARHCGVIFSACCSAIATVTTVTTKRSSTRDSRKMALQTKGVH